MVEFGGKVISAKKGLFQEDLLESGFEFKDKTNFEVDFDYFIQKGMKRTSYSITGYMFIPDELKIEPDTYSKEQFFHDFQSRLRFQTPVFPLSAILRKDNHLSPLTRIFEIIDNIMTGNLEDDILNKKMVYELKMHAQIVRSNLRNQIVSLIDMCPAGEPNEIVLDSLHDLIGEVNAIQDRFHELESIIFNSQFPEKTRACYHACDEYISYYLEHYFTILLDKMSNSDCYTIIAPDIRELIVRRQNRRLKMNYSLVIGHEIKKSTRDPTKFHFWKTFLKRYIKQVLELEIKKREDKAKYMQVIGAFGAMVAMAVFLIFSVALLDTTVQNSFPFIIAALVAYAFKDRIKAAINLSGERMLSKWVSDRRFEIIDTKEHEKIGVFKESMRFVKTKDVPADVMEIRNKDRPSVLERDVEIEKVILYKKVITLDAGKILKMHERHKNLSDVLQINIQNFLTHAWDPEEHVIYFNATKNSIEHVPVPLVYHVNMVLKQAFLTKEGQEKIKYKRIRVIFNKNGIDKVEEA